MKKQHFLYLNLKWFMNPGGNEKQVSKWNFAFIDRI